MSLAEETLKSSMSSSHDQEDPDMSLSYREPPPTMKKASSSSTTPLSNKNDNNGLVKPWPEDREDQRILPLSSSNNNNNNNDNNINSNNSNSNSFPRRLLRTTCNALFYSYMSPILKRGAKLHKARTTNRKNEQKQKLKDQLKHEADEEDSTVAAATPTTTTSSMPHDDLKELSKHDVYTVPRAMEAQHLATLFWSAQRSTQQTTNSNDKKHANQNQTNNTNQHQPSAPSTLSFLKVLYQISKPTYLPAALWQFITVLCQCSLPLLVRQVLLKLESHPSQSFRSEGLLLALLIFSVSLLEGIGNERQKFLSFQTGITLRSAVVSAAHNHVLNMTPRGRAGLTSGEITNLVAVDAQKLVELAQEGHYSWSCPLAMIIVSVLLLLELGPAAIVGIVAMFLIVPLVQYVVGKMMFIRKQRVMAADARVESIGAMLQGIRFTKLNCYEEQFIERVMGQRRKEVRLLRRELFFLALTIFATVVSPVVASGVTFITYTLIGSEEEPNVLSPSMTFTSLFLFAALRFPINYAGKFMGKAAQGFQACHRFALFFARESSMSRINSGGGGVGSGGISHGAMINGDIEIVESSRYMFDSTIEGGGEFGKLQVAPIEDPMEDVETSDSTETDGRGLVRQQSLSLQDDEPSEDSDDGPLIHVNASFSVGSSSNASFTISKMQFSVQRSQIMCVVGPVASGKSTLVQGLIGELLPLPSEPNNTCQVKGRVSYASQIPFILNATVRDNILFGEPYDKLRYERVLDACCLTTDIEQFHSKDLTEIGERGVTLSGGQKQRLSLARVAYSQPDVAILDDPLSALDAGTGKRVFEKLFKPSGDDGLFANTAVVLVTHASHFLNRVDSILVLVNGNSVFVGSWGELAACHPSDPNEVDAIEAIRSSVQEEHSEGCDASNAEADTAQHSTIAVAASAIQQKSSACAQGSDPTKCEKNDDDSKEGRIMTVEERKYGLSQISTWLNWFKFAGGTCFFIMIVISMTFDRFMYVATEWWLAQWTRGVDEPIYRFGRWYPAQTDGEHAQYGYIVTYLLILVVSLITTILRTNWIIQGGARCSSRLFVMMLSRVLYAPMSYFDTTPIGRLMNRFTYDTETLDVTLTMNMTMLMTSLGWIFTGIILQSVILPWQLFAILFIVVMYWLLVLHYRKSAVDLQRLDATSRSPVQAQLSEAIDGTATIRVFGKTAYFSNVFRLSLDENSGMMMNFMAAHRWLAVRIQLLGACAVLFSISFVAAFNDVLNLDPGIAAILIIWSANFNISLSFFVQGISESEASMTSLERVLAMTEIPQEESEVQKSLPADDAWPSTGDLTFEDVNLRYRPGLPLSLNGLTFSLKSGQRCGVVGRTGAGKSTLASALFRLVELEGGKILFDGVDISELSLQDVRGRKNGMTIIPQEPVLFPGTLKQCLDPFGDFSDYDVQDALHSVRGVSRGLNDLNATVEEGGKNFSVGERQLICLGRAMLAKPKLLFLDEATASVDGETDALIQKMLRSRFVGTTLLTIAHRLNTIMDYDVILVIDAGRCAEFGTPAELLANTDGIFSQLVESTGRESSAALRSMVIDP